MKNKYYINKMSREKIISNIDVYKSYWKNMLTTNCYAYALGLDIPEHKICYNAYQPGIMSTNHSLNIEEETFSYDDLINGINNDFDFLRIEAHEVRSDYKAKEDEWKIALFVSSMILETQNIIDDYHFLKQFPSGNWWHKFGFKGKIINIDDNIEPIRDPIDCQLQGLIYDKTLCLKLKK